MADGQVEDYYAGIQDANDDAGEWQFPCNANLPSLSFLIGPTEYATIPAKYLIYEATDNTRESNYSSSSSSYVMFLLGLVFFH